MSGIRGIWRVGEFDMPPQACIACGGNPPDDEGHPMEAYIADQVDVNWGDALGLCRECVDVLVQLRGAASAEDFDGLKVRLVSVETERDALKAETERLQDRLDAILDGARAKSAARKERDAASKR